MKTLVLTLCAGLAAVAAWAQDASAPAPAGNGNAVTLGRTLPVADAVAQMAKAAGATVVVDPAVGGSVREAVAKQPLEQGLASIAASQKVQWRKVFMKDTDIPKTKEGAVDAAKLRAMVEATSLAPPVSVAVVDPASGMLLSATRAPLNSQATKDWLQDRKEMYVLYRPSVPGSAMGAVSSDNVSDYLTVQKNSMEAFNKMSPEQRKEAMKQGIEMFLNMDPQAMGQMMQQQMQAFMDLPPETKAKLMEVSMKMMSNGATPPPPPPAP